MEVWPGSYPGSYPQKTPSLPQTRASWLGRGIGHHQGTLAMRNSWHENLPPWKWWWFFTWKCYPFRIGKPTSNIQASNFWGCKGPLNPERVWLASHSLGVLGALNGLAMRQWLGAPSFPSMMWFKGQEQSPKYPRGLASLSPCQPWQIYKKKSCCPYFRAVSCWELTFSSWHWFDH